MVDRARVRLLLRICLFIILLLPRVLSLDAHWSSDEGRWLYRSARFMSTVKTAEFSDTLVAYHPGVTVMWLAGLRTFFVESKADVENLARARWFISIVVWAGIGLICLLLYRLFGEWIALVSFACLAYSPLFLAQARRVHTDALAATFILLTVLLFLIYCQQHHHRYLIFSGISFGLAILSKSYAFILLPWIPVCLFLFREQGSGFWRQLSEILGFLTGAVLTIISLWPIFWTPTFGLVPLYLFGVSVLLLRDLKKARVNPYIVVLVGAILILVCQRVIQTFWFVFESVNWAFSTPHEVEHFFFGTIVNDPGWLFYPFVLTIKSTPLMLPLSIVGCLLLWKQRKHTEQTARHFKTGVALVLGVLLFTFCLSATSKKFSRYLLPAFLLLEVFAAIGFIEGLKWSYKRLVSRFGAAETAKYKTALAIIACIGFFFIQVLPVLARHPYYGTYYNLCWKVTDITKIITVGDASGLDIAANYLNEKADAQQKVVQVSPLSAEFFRYYFQGFAYRADRKLEHSPDYEVVYIRDSQIGRVPQTGTLNGELEAVITLNGIDHVWIYRIPDTTETP